MKTNVGNGEAWLSKKTYKLRGKNVMFSKRFLADIKGSHTSYE